MTPIGSTLKILHAHFFIRVKSSLSSFSPTLDMRLPAYDSRIMPITQATYDLFVEYRDAHVLKITRAASGLFPASAMLPLA